MLVVLRMLSMVLGLVEKANGVRVYAERSPAKMSLGTSSCYALWSVQFGFMTVLLPTSGDLLHRRRAHESWQIADGSLSRLSCHGSITTICPAFGLDCAATVKALVTHLELDNGVVSSPAFNWLQNSTCVCEWSQG